MRENCIVCSVARGRRVCQLNSGALICPICCAKTRHSECEGCEYYEKSLELGKQKVQPTKSRPFIIELNPEIEEKVDDALQMAEKGRVSLAENEITKLLIKHPNNHSVQFAMGVICLMKKNDEGAIKYFDRAIAIFPDFIEAWFNKGAAHQRKLDVGEMIHSFQKVIELGDPKEDFVRQAKNILTGFEKQVKKESGITLDTYLQAMDKFTSAFSEMEKRNWERALNGFQEVLSVNPKHVQSFGNIGICYAALGRKQEALDALNRALELDPKYEPAILNREMIKTLREGEKAPIPEVKPIEYYKDFSIKKRSLLSELFNK
ncbi:MAG TPA: tetratricopeptide repeat protein [bacterium]